MAAALTPMITTIAGISKAERCSVIIDESHSEELCQVTMQLAPQEVPEKE
jgi:hypothetical protein